MKRQKISAWTKIKISSYNFQKMGLKNFLKSLYITFTLVLVFLSSIPKTETWQPDNGRLNSVSSKSNQNTEVPQKRSSGENLRKRMALPLDVSKDITQEKEINYSKINNPEPHQTTNEAISITADNYSASNKVIQNLNPRIIRTSNISKNNAEGASPDDLITSISKEETAIPLVDRMEGIFGSRNGTFDFGAGERKTMNNDEFNSVEEFYIHQDEAEEDQEPCMNNHDDHFKSSASKLYTKGPKLAYAYIAGLWLTAFMTRIINAVRKN